MKHLKKHLKDHIKIAQSIDLKSINEILKSNMISKVVTDIN